ncbi:MAG: hypothetical protein AAGI69_04095 [Cyanobacteria bacterium P01_H01_bin.21]
MLNPWLWLGILVTGIVGIYAWEYRQNPGQLPWQIGATGPGSSGDATSTDALLESLTPEEQAVAAELDNIELLLEQFDSDISALTSGGEESAAATLNESLDGSEPTETSVERLSRYIEEYNFLGTGARGSNVEPERRPGASLAQQPLTLQADEPATVLPRSALSDALDRQQVEQEAASQQPVQESAEQPGNGSLAENPEGTDAETSNFSFDQSGVVPGSLNGLNRSFIRTTPEMSPPPGTTGYVPPATLPSFSNQNQQAGVVPFSTQQLPTRSFESVTPSSAPERSQVLPPAERGVNTPLQTPTVDSSSQPAPDPPRNAWDDFWN